MDIVYPRCCGLDIHKRSVVACLIVSEPEGRPRKEIRTFGTLTDEIQKLSDWLRVNKVTHVAMESTGIYVRRITAHAIPPTRRTGSEGNPWVND